MERKTLNLCSAAEIALIYNVNCPYKVTLSDYATVADCKHVTKLQLPVIIYKGRL